MEKDLEPKIRDQEELKRFVNENIHKVRNCYEYYDEYYECSRIKGRFHQYFIFGEFLDCSSWKSDYKNCEDLQHKEENLEQLASIIRHEDERREQRLKNHLQNDVWPKRTEPPANWNSELPKWMVDKKMEEEFRTNRHIQRLASEYLEDAKTTFSSNLVCMNKEESEKNLNKIVPTLKKTYH